MRRLVPFVLVAALAFTAGHSLSSPSATAEPLELDSQIQILRPTGTSSPPVSRTTLRVIRVHRVSAGDDRRSQPRPAETPWVITIGDTIYTAVPEPITQ